MRNPFKRKPRLTEAEQRQAQLDDFQARLDGIEKMADPAEKFLGLERLQQSIDNCVEEARTKISRKARRFTGLIAGGGGLGGMGGVLFLASALHCAPLLLVALTCVPGASLGGEYHEKSRRRKMFAETAAFFEELKAKKQKAAGLADEILNKDLDVLKASPKYPDLLRYLPRHRIEFLAAAAKPEQKETRDEAAAAAPKPPGGKLHL